MIRALVLLVTHGLALAAGFAGGIYALPILTAPPPPDAAALRAAMDGAAFRATLDRDLPGTDALHWGEGTVAVSPERIAHEGRLAPGPDYKLYLTPGVVGDEAGFAAVREASVRVGDVRGFDGFVLDVPPGVDVAAYGAVLIWCEAFGEFIAAGAYR